MMKLTYRIKFIGLFILLTCSANSVQADTHQQNKNLVVSPKRCVALRQGQTCYQEVTFKWQQLQIGDYCLVELPTQEVLKCWQQSRSGEFDFDFQYSQSTIFALRKEGHQQNVSETPITVSWVFKSSKRPKSSWKLF
jgi:hypothetical protein